MCAGCVGVDTQTSQTSQTSQTQNPSSTASFNDSAARQIFWDTSAYALGVENWRVAPVIGTTSLTKSGSMPYYVIKGEITVDRADGTKTRHSAVMWIVEDYHIVRFTVDGQMLLNKVMYMYAYSEWQDGIRDTKPVYEDFQNDFDI